MIASLVQEFLLNKWEVSKNSYQCVGVKTKSASASVAA